MPYHPLIYGALAFLISLPVIYWLTGEIRWKFALYVAIGATIGNFIGSMI
ncbi:putative membrane protein [Methanohalophilus levihalophilus]|nr:hypothetical protein [Methanohalophilus levihalophilus]MBP2029835.1 putative membrane protein [Methanohalophilus levihalophilus]